MELRNPTPLDNFLFDLNGMGYHVQTKFCACAFAGNTCPIVVASGQACPFGVAGYGAAFSFWQMLRQPTLAPHQQLLLLRQRL